MLQSTNLKFTADDLLWLLVATERYQSICKARSDEPCKEIADAQQKMNEIWYKLPEGKQLEIFEEK